MRAGVRSSMLCLLVCMGIPALGAAEDGVLATAEYRGTWEVVKFDVSPPLREIEPLPIPEGSPWGGLMIDLDSELAGPSHTRTST
jgi:hypothetical protein